MNQPPWRDDLRLMDDILLFARRLTLDDGVLFDMVVAVVFGDRWGKNHLPLHFCHVSLRMIARRASSTFTVTFIFSHISLNGGTSYTDPITFMKNAASSIIVAVAVIDIGYTNLMAHHKGSLPVAHRWW
jgi:hypothetical protein